MPRQRILVCGAGVAGGIVAFWLGKHDFEIVVVERSKADQKAGQTIDVEEPALQVLREMGVMPELETMKTGEEGFHIVDEKDRVRAAFGVGEFSVTAELELMRGDLVQVLNKAASESPNVSYRFETTIQGLRQLPDKVIVDLENRTTKATSTEEFDFVIGADGVKSRTRQMVMGSPEQIGCFKPVGAQIAYLSIEKEKHDPHVSRLCAFPGSRSVWLRPISEESDYVSAMLIHFNQDVPALKEANASADRMKQKEAFAKLYSGLGWETPRVIEQMMKADNFYSDDLVQVKLDRWSQGRVVLLGDSAWAPTPFTGQGNQLAILGAWVLAQEMSRHDGLEAFQRYEKRFRPYVENAQKIPLDGKLPSLFSPRTAAGIWAVRTLASGAAMLVRFLMWTGLAKLLPAGGHEAFDLEIEQTSKA